MTLGTLCRVERVSKFRARQDKAHCTTRDAESFTQSRTAQRNTVLTPDFGLRRAVDHCELGRRRASVVCVVDQSGNLVYLG